MKRRYYVYILSNQRRTVYYVGVTNSIERRYFEHLWKKNPKSFCVRYNINELLYFEDYTDVDQAIAREKQLKRWGRDKKVLLVKRVNPEMRNYLC